MLLKPTIDGASDHASTHTQGFGDELLGLRAARLGCAGRLDGVGRVTADHSTGVVTVDHDPDLDADLARNYSEQLVVLCTEGSFRGHDGLRWLAARLKRELPEAEFTYRTIVVEDEFGFLEWGPPPLKERCATAQTPMSSATGASWPRRSTTPSRGHDRHRGPSGRLDEDRDNDVERLLRNLSTPDQPPRPLDPRVTVLSLGEVLAEAGFPIRFVTVLDTCADDTAGERGGAIPIDLARRVDRQRTEAE